MPYEVNQMRRHNLPKRYRVSNRHEYDRALQARGSLTLSVTPEAIAACWPRSSEHEVLRGLMAGADSTTVIHPRTTQQNLRSHHC